MTCVGMFCSMAWPFIESTFEVFDASDLATGAARFNTAGDVVRQGVGRSLCGAQPGRATRRESLPGKPQHPAKAVPRRLLPATTGRAENRGDLCRTMPFRGLRRVQQCASCQYALSPEHSLLRRGQRCALPQAVLRRTKQGDVEDTVMPRPAEIPWEPSLLANAVYQPPVMYQGCRLREQARSHSGSMFRPESAANTKPVGAELARECGVSATSDVSGLPPSRASSLPQWFYVQTGICGKHQTCGSRACSRTRCISHQCCITAAAFASKLAPTVVLCSDRNLRQTPNLWEPSLLANAVYQPPVMYQGCRLREQARSHSGSMFRPESAANTKPVEAELARECGVSATSDVSGLPPSRASSLPQWFYVQTGICGKHQTCGSRACSRTRCTSHQCCTTAAAFASKLAPTVVLC